MMNEKYFFLLTGLLIGALTGGWIGWLLAHSRWAAKWSGLQTEKENLTREKQRLDERLREMEQLLEQNRENHRRDQMNHVEALARKEREISLLTERLQAQNREWESRREQWQSERERLQNEFAEREKYLSEKLENLARKILDDTTRKFTEHNRQKLDEIIRPFKDDLRQFKQKVEETDKQHLERTASLIQHLKSLEELNRQITRDAQNLTRALKGESKTQGIWGEAVLHRVLEMSGLEEGREYIAEQSFNTTEHESRQRLRPDVIVYLPGNKSVIIDAKVSLKAYEQFVNAETDEMRDLALKEHLQSVKTHIAELSKKEYHRLDEMQGRTPDFVLMFIPVEPAFAAALKAQPDLYDEALRKNIVLTTPTTLLALLKMVDNMWKNEYRHKNIREILRQATSLYDKFVGFSDDLIKLGKKLDEAKDTYSASMNKLSQGKDNLVSKVERLRKLGLSPKKELHPGLRQRALDDALPEDTDGEE